MPSFSASSHRNLNSCESPLVLLFNAVVAEYDCTVLVGLRGKEEQDELLRRGLSKLSWPNSKHNVRNDGSLQLSRAVDVAPYPIDWNNREHFVHFAGFVRGRASALDIRLRWGGDWDGDFDLADQTFMDLVHYELVR